MKKPRFTNATFIACCILLATVLFSSCNSEAEKENKALKIRIELLEVKIIQLNKIDSLHAITLQKLANQDNNTLDVIKMHLKYNHRFE